MTQLDLIWMVKCGCDLPSGYQSQSFYAVEVGMLDGHDTSICEELLGPIIDQLSVDEAVYPMCLDLIHLRLHLLLFCLLQLRKLPSRPDFNTSTKYLDLVCVHGSICYQNLGLL